MQRRKFIKLAGGGIVLANLAAPTTVGAMFDVPNSAIAAGGRQTLI
jgi:hypothetical protein